MKRSDRKKIEFPLSECRFSGRNEWGPRVDCDHKKNEMKICSDESCPLHMIREELRCFFVEAKGHDEPNGVAVIAYTPGEAKSRAWSYLCQFDIEWVDLRPGITKGANIEGLTDGTIFGDCGDETLWDALYRHIYGSLYFGVCPNCKAEDVAVNEIYDDVF